MFQILGVLWIILSVSLSLESIDESECVNYCSGNGICKGYICHCSAGYYGEDCSKRGSNFKVFEAGHFNLTAKRLYELKKNVPLLLVGFSSSACQACSYYEVEYSKVANSTEVPFGRMDINLYKSLARKYMIQESPALLLFHSGNPIVYQGPHDANSILQYLRKQSGPDITELHSLEEMDNFMAKKVQSNARGKMSFVIGCFSDIQSMEEDEYADFLEGAKELKPQHNAYVLLFAGRGFFEKLKELKWIDRSPSILLIVFDTTKVVEKRVSINLDESDNESESIFDWVMKNSLSMLEELTPYNFAQFETLNLPMLILFLDLDGNLNQYQLILKSLIAHFSGGIRNNLLLSHMREASLDHLGRISFVYANGQKYDERMRTLGLLDGASSLPAIAFNLKDNRILPYPKEAAFDTASILGFCAAFISGRLQDSRDAQRAISSFQNQDSTMIPKQDKQVEKIPVIKGVSEDFTDSNIPSLDRESFKKVVLNDHNDVVVLFHAPACIPCAHLIPYYKKVAHRVSEIQGSLHKKASLIVTHMDISTQIPPILIEELPSMIMFPAFDKEPPYRKFSGEGSVLGMLQWIQSTSVHPLHLPLLPQFNDHERQVYIQQIHDIHRKRSRDEL